MDSQMGSSTTSYRTVGDQIGERVVTLGLEIMIQLVKGYVESKCIHHIQSSSDIHHIYIISINYEVHSYKQNSYGSDNHDVLKRFKDIQH